MTGIGTALFLGLASQAWAVQHFPGVSAQSVLHSSRQVFVVRVSLILIGNWSLLRSFLFFKIK